MNRNPLQTDLSPTLKQFKGAKTHTWLSGDPDRPLLDEHDACAIVASVRKGGQDTHGNLNRVIKALSKMGHRSGEVNGEGDGCGLLTDIPRLLWSDALEELGKPSWLAEDRRFFVGHLMITKDNQNRDQTILHTILQLIHQAGGDVLISRPGQTRPPALGKQATEQEPLFWQIAGVMSNCALETVERHLFELTLAIEHRTGVHVASLSSHSVVYKVRGSIETLYHYYPELRSPRYMSAITLGHTRYSTNTTTAFERVQPFNYLGHNGEINTISRLREQARMLGTQLVENGSDSQDLDRTVGTLIHHYGFTLTEVLELVFPPILSEVEKLPSDMQAVYNHYRQAFGPFAQGPAAIIARYGDECTFSIDALGLRPLWFGETEKEFFFSSEKGVYHLDSLCNDPRPLSPGEKMTVRVHRNNSIDILEYPAVQERVLKLARRRFGTLSSLCPSLPKPQSSATSCATTSPLPPSPARLLAAFGWGREGREWVKFLAKNGYDPIGSLGHDGPLAALASQRQNVADNFKEAVAVVTNPSIDREREKEHFSTQVVLGVRPSLQLTGEGLAPRITLDCPVLLGGEADHGLLPPETQGELARRLGTMRLEDIVATFGENAVVSLPIVTEPGEALPDALDRLAEVAIDAARAGIKLFILDDTGSFQDGHGWVDPHPAIAVIDRALRMTFTEAQPWDAPQPLAVDPSGRIDLSQVLSPRPVSLRRQVGLVLRSGAIRNLHDLIMALGLGADAVAPYMLLEVSVDDLKRELLKSERAERLENVIHALRAGLEKVTSTMGIHELRGYGRLFASIGLSKAVATAMGTTNYYGSEDRGLTWEDLEAEIDERMAIAIGEGRANLSRVEHFYPKVWKAAGQVGLGEGKRDTFERKAATVTRRTPVTLRHILDFRYPDVPTPIDPTVVDAGLTDHDLPFVISSMSFGSQGETTFRAYAEGAYRLNMICVNGEGGEILDMMGLYPHNRGQQIASGRFGVDINLINSSNLLEIKIGQGAKPGEGGHLPGRKVSLRVAAARHARQGVDLISPSNNHDIYSIEDLAQFIEELKTANPKARVAVKVPVVPGIGIISVGIAKAGADIINLTGYDGGTGAARQHSLRHVGLPAEIGVVEAHKFLTESGLRHRVELWCDGGMRTASDAVKMTCLGANRVGFGTLAMVAIGCTICRACQTDTCHVGIATQIESVAQAKARNLRRFIPQEFEYAVQGIVNLFGALGEEVKRLTAQLGFESTQDLVGRTDLLEQISHHDQIDLTEMLTHIKNPLDENKVARPLQLSSGVQFSQHPLRRPRNHLTTVISNMVMETAITGEEKISFEDDKVSSVDRALGTHLAGALTRYTRDWMWAPGHGGVGGLPESWRPPVQAYAVNSQTGNVESFVPEVSTHVIERPNSQNVYPSNDHHVRETNLRFYASSVPGNGLGAYCAPPLNITVEGGAQDGVGKGMHGGRLVVMKGYNHDGVRVDGSVGKGPAYGAIGGLIIVQGDADSRACIRLSGADVIIGGEIRQPINDSLGYIGARANVKGFLCEYMTAGRVLVLGDPGPWICAGMTGGVLYLRLQPRMNFDMAAIQRRVAQGAQVRILPADESDELNLTYLLNVYAEELNRSHQTRDAHRILDLLQNWKTTFVKVEPDNLQMDQTISTE